MRKQIEGRLDLTSFVPVDLVVRFVRPCVPCVPCVSRVRPGSPRCVSRLPPVSFYPFTGRLAPKTFFAKLPPLSARLLRLARRAACALVARRPPPSAVVARAPVGCPERRLRSHRIARWYRTSFSLNVCVCEGACE